jgi:hypothetical protein
LVVEDSAACQKTIQSPVAQQVLKTDGAGNLTWTNGASGTILRKDSTGLLEFATLNSVLQSGSVDLGSQPLTTTGAVSTGAINATSLTATGAVNSASVTATGAGSFKSISVTNTGTGNGISIQTVDGIPFSIQANDTTPIQGGSLKIFDPLAGDFVFDGASDGLFVFNNTSTAITKGTVFNGANVGIGVGTSSPAKTLHVNGTVRLQGLPTYANNAAAISGGLVADDVYKTSTGELRIVV